jgi:acyl-CoA thioester hydrolase
VWSEVGRASPSPRCFVLRRKAAKSGIVVHAFRLERVTLNMPESMITYRGVVYPWHCDHMGHMNVMWYVGKFDEATWQLLASVGATPSRLREGGFGLVAVEQHIQYKRELRSGDLLTIRSSILEGKEKSLRFSHEMTNDQTGDVAAIMLVVGVCIDSMARKARELPPDILERIRSSL